MGFPRPYDQEGIVKDRPIIARRPAAFLRGRKMRLFVAALVLAAVVPARAHHPFAPYYDASKLVSVAGVIVELRDVNPHAVLIVDGTTTDGRSGKWAFEGLPQRLPVPRFEGLRDKLRTGTSMTISGWAAKESDGTGVQRTRGHLRGRVNDALRDQRTGGGDEGWRCSSRPVPVPLSGGAVELAVDHSGAKSRVICCSTFGSTTRVSPLSGSFSE